MGYTAKLSERLALVATIDPDQRGAGSVNTDVIDMAVHRRALAVILVGDIAATGTLDVTAFANTTNSTSGGTAITSKSLAADTFSETGDSAKQALIEVTAEEVAAAVDGGRYLFFTATVANANVDYAVGVLAGDSRYLAADSNLASVAEIVS